jgi:hypothetical protein
MNESDEHPMGDQFGQGSHYGIVESDVRIFRALRRRIMTPDGIICENTKTAYISPRGKILERTDSQMA